MSKFAAKSLNVFCLTWMSHTLSCETWIAHRARATIELSEKVTPKIIPL